MNTEITYEDAELAGWLKAKNLWEGDQVDLIESNLGAYHEIPETILTAKPSKLSAYLTGYERFFVALREG